MEKEEELYERWSPRRRLGIMGKMGFGHKRRVLKEGDVLDGCEIDSCAFDRIGCDAKPRTECGRVSRRIVVFMLSHVGRQLRVDNPTERHKPECEHADYDLSNATCHHLYRGAAAFTGSCF